MAEVVDSRLGATLGNYRIVRELGRGGMGIVYLGEHVYLGRRVALKVLHGSYAGSDEAVGRFLREACAASAINHPNIVEVLDFGEAPDGGVFLIMEYLEGESLAAALRRFGPLPLGRALDILKQITSALGAAHDIGIFHRDLKPENVVLTRGGGRRARGRRLLDEPDFAAETTGDFVKLLDFGVAKVLEPKPGHEGSAEHETAWAAVSTHADAIFGTPEYMAPEIARGAAADPRSEVYALGVMFYEMLTGSVPFAGTPPPETLWRHAEEEVVPPSARCPGAEILPLCDEIILRALAKRPDDRQQSMAELFEDLRLCQLVVGDAVARAGLEDERPTPPPLPVRRAGPGGRPPEPRPAEGEGPQPRGTIVGAPPVLPRQDGPESVRNTLPLGTAPLATVDTDHDDGFES